MKTGYIKRFKFSPSQLSKNNIKNLLHTVPKSKWWHYASKKKKCSSRQCVESLYANNRIWKKISYFPRLVTILHKYMIQDYVCFFNFCTGEPILIPSYFVHLCFDSDFQPPLHLILVITFYVGCLYCELIWAPFTS